MPEFLHVMTSANDERFPALSWETDIPIATHPVMLANFGLLFAATGVLVAVLLAFILFVTGRAQAIEPVLEWTAFFTAGLFLFSLAVSVVIFGNRLKMRFKLDGDAAEAEVTDQRAKIVRRAGAAFSWVASRFGLAGAGLIAETSASQHVSWATIARADFHPLWRTVSLSNGWRTVLILFCTQQNYDAVAAAVHAGLAARRPPSLENPLPALLFRTFLVLLSSMPLFAMPYVEKDGVFPALLILVFALSSVWLMPRLAWLVLLSLLWSFTLEVIACFSLRESLFGGNYRAYQVLNLGDAITLVMVIAGMACLAVLSVALLTGRIRSGLAGNMLEREAEPRV